MPDSTVLSPSNTLYLSPMKKGRHVSFLGDNRSARRISNLIYGSDIVVHEAPIGPIPDDVVPKEGLIGSRWLSIGL